MDFSELTSSKQYVADTNRKKWPRWMQFFPPAWVIMLAWFIVRIPVLITQQQRRTTVLATFAAKHNFWYEGVRPKSPAKTSLKPGAPVHLPYEVVTIDRVLDRMSGTIRSMPFEYLSTTVKMTAPLDGAKEGHGLPVTTTFFRFTVPATLPRLYIQPKQGFHRGAKLPATAFTKPWEYVLEGTFPKHYRVFGERDERLDIYMVLSPEVMWQLVQHQFYDIWMHDNEIVLVAYGAGRRDYFTQLPVAFTIADMLASEVDRISRVLRRAGH